MDKVVGDFSYEGVDAIPIEEDTREWKVYFDNNFWGYPKGERAGTEIRLDREFDWAGYHWVIPAVYACEKGLVMEFCRRVEVEDIRDFMKKWNLSAENDSCAHISQEQRMQLDLDNPLCLHFNPRLELNGETMQTTHGSGGGASIPACRRGCFMNRKRKGHWNTMAWICPTDGRFTGMHFHGQMRAK